MTATRKKMSPLDAALACQQKGDLDGAEESFRAALDQDPDDPDALVLLGVLLQKTKRAEEALTLIERGIAAALKRGRQPAPAWRVALAYAKRDAGDLEGALAIFDVLVEQAPGVPEPLFLRAGILQRLERHEDAIADYEAVLKHAPNDAKALNNLGVSLKAEKQLGDALTAFHKAVEIRPDYVQAAGNAGELLSDIGQMEAAIAMLRRAHSLEPENRNVEITLIDALQKGEMAEEAERLAERAFERDPDSVRAMVHLGNIRMVMGRRDEAVELAHRAREAEPDAPGVLSLLAEADRDIDAESLLADIERVVAELQDEDPPLGLHFAAAGLYERLKRYPEAFGHYRAGNAVRQEQLERLGEAYKPDRVTQRIDQLIATFDAERCAGPGGSSSELPVFIVGMPRSGTTLTEQILASHPDAAGELKEIGQIVTWLTRQHGFPVTLRQEHLREAAGGYLRHVGNVGKGAARVTDKMPGNYMHLGLIARMFPRARIIHCRRDPMDNCLSCFAQNFAADGLGWSTDLRDMGHQYCQYRRILDHWRAVLPPGRMLEIDYEDTVADLDVQARRLVDFVGLKWDESCLSFHKTERAVVTASRAQVRNPIYASSVGRWRRYGDGVAPLIEALSACGCGPSGD
jgi:tetratricopeptide (TPR) repeat protein